MREEFESYASDKTLTSTLYIVSTIQQRNINNNHPDFKISKCF